MKRKIISALIAAMMLVLVVCQSVCGENLGEYTLFEKMQRQIESGSGIKGNVTLQAEGSASWLTWLIPLSGHDVQLRKISVGDDKETRLYFADGETEYNLLHFRDVGGSVLVTSDVLESKKISIPEGMWKKNQWNNPSWYMLPIKMGGISSLLWKAQWQENIEPYFGAIDVWMQQFASEPSVEKNDNGQTIITISYDIPLSGIKEELCALVDTLFADEALLSLLQDTAGEESAAVYLNPSLVPAYKAMIMAIPENDGTSGSHIRIERKMSAQGNNISTEISLPLRNVGDYDTLTITQGEAETKYVLQGKTRSFVLDYCTDGPSSYHGCLFMEPASMSEENPSFAVAFNMEKTVTSEIDEEGTAKETSDIRLVITPACDNPLYQGQVSDFSVDFMPVTASMHFVINSKNSPSSPTKIEFTLSAEAEDATLSAAGAVKSAAPWTIQPLNDENSVSLENITDDGMKQLFDDYMSSLSAHE